MRIIITGVAGFLGGNLARQLIKNGHEVKGLDNLSFGIIDNVPDDIIFFQVPFQIIRNSTCEWADVLVHCATSNLIYSQNFPVETVINNGLDSMNLFKRFKKKIINISTASVYGDATTFPTKESDNIKVSGSYDTSKRICELYLEQRKDFTTIRPANIYGVYQQPSNPYCGVIGKFVEAALKDKPMKIYGDGEQKRSYTYVSDTVDAIIKTIELPSMNTEINISSQEEVSAKELSKLVWKVADKVQKYERVEPRSIDGITRRCLDISKAERLLGWKPTTSLEDGIKKTVQWQREQNKQLSL